MSISATYSKNEVVDKEFQYSPEAEDGEKKMLGTLKNNLRPLQNDISAHLTSLLKAAGAEDVVADEAEEEEAEEEEEEEEEEERDEYVLETKWYVVSMEINVDVILMVSVRVVLGIWVEKDWEGLGRRPIKWEYILKFIQQLI